MDFTKLRAAALKDGDDEEAVTVNTRALIDKVLARYSGEWTTLRELLQNAADAQASSVTIRFETLPSANVPLANTTNGSEVLKHVLQHHTLRRLLVTNNGQPFGVNDWSRLKRIAEGNPDETKIGAFGVGFYSVFADCEDPFVSSGDQAMAFYWKGNALFTKKVQLPPDQRNPNTSFVLDYRNSTTPMPNLLSISQFLATSLTFVALQQVELWVDDWKIISLRKKAAPSIEVPIGKDVDTKTKDGYMRVTSMERESVRMDATFMNVIGWKPSMSASIGRSGIDGNYGSSLGESAPLLRSFFSRLSTSTSHAQLKSKAMREERLLQEIVLEDVTATTTANVFLRVTTAAVRTSVPASFASELERATKKPPPKTTKLAILTASYDEVAASTRENTIAKGVDVFASVLPSKKPGGRIFIGFPTHQTTGNGMHLSAPSVIPTVERESIDLNARWVRTWNIEMLRVAGIMARMAFTNEMADLNAKIKYATEKNGHGTKVTKDEIAHFMPEALHNLKTFTFEESTPSSQVSQIIEEAFWTAYKKASIEIYSSRGILPTTEVRLATEDLSGFVEGLPVIPDELLGSTFVNKLKDFGLVTEITINDVKQELGMKALSKDQLVQFIGWAGRKAISNDIDGPTIHALMDAAVAVNGDADGGEVITLGTIKNYLNVNKIPADAPVPPETIPFQFTRGIANNLLESLGWEPLEIVPWLRYLVTSNGQRPAEKSLTASVQFSSQVLQILSKSWDLLNVGSKSTVVSLVQPIAMVPTKAGMKKAGEAYFPHVKLFDDLPTVICPAVKEKFLSALGVRKTVDLELIFQRILDPNTASKPGDKPTNSKHMEVIKYLASVRNDIPAEDMRRLEESQFCAAEAGPSGVEATRGSTKLFRVNDLYEPKEELRGLGLNILQWPGPPGSFRPASPEGRLLALLGLKAYPSVNELIKMMADDKAGDGRLRQKAMRYFCDHFGMHGYTSSEVRATQLAFLPLEGEKDIWVASGECFTNESCSAFGFNILRRDLHIHASKFGVALDPDIAKCVSHLVKNPPATTRDARIKFEYLASRLGELGPAVLGQLGNAYIVPINSISKRSNLNGSSDDKLVLNGMKRLTPRQCYVGSSVKYDDIFEFVDFGGTANMFLLKCGAKMEPTVNELAKLACEEPARLLDTLKIEKYAELLKTLAASLSQLKKDKTLLHQMRHSKFLLGTVDIVAPRKPEHVTGSDAADDGYGSEEEFYDTSIKQNKLCLPSQVVINDDYQAYRLFRGSLICAPEDEKLEDFYFELGSKNLRSLVQEDFILGRVSDKQGEAADLGKHILERTKIFLSEGFQKDNIKHDSRWLEKNLNVQVVTSISMRRSLPGHNLSNIEKRSAVSQHERHKGWTLSVVAGKRKYYEISQAIGKIILERPTQSSLVTFETFLVYNLFELRARGYNVERILRAKAAEQRIAEEERQKQFEGEQQQLKAQEEQWKQQNQASTAVAARDQRNGRSSDLPPIPGAFETSPENSPMPFQKKPGGLFSGFTKKLGLNSGNNDIQQQLQNFLGGGNANAGPSTASPSDGRGPADDPPTYDEANQVVKRPTKVHNGGENVSSPHAIQQNLLNAIQSSRAYDSSSLFSPPSTTNVKETASYCDATHSHDITYIADASNGTRIFVTKTLSSPTTFLSERLPLLNTFSSLLHTIADVYMLPRKAMHIFYDESGGTIAFNSSGSIFCNFRFFLKLHADKYAAGTKEAIQEGLTYWWVVLAHELAHNLVTDHSANHSFYTESLIQNYFPKMMAKTIAITAAKVPRALIDAA